MDSVKAKPFVKWVGGKSQLISEIERSLPLNLLAVGNLTYVEPFVGGGAVLFWILQKFSNISRAVINDINGDLVNAYNVVKHHPYQLIEQLESLQYNYLLCDSIGRKSFYLERRAEFNSRCNSDIEQAALFIFLNKTCFNGLYRVNSQGSFNVPHGDYKNPKICDAPTILADSKVLQGVEVLCGDFSQTLLYAGENTLYYLDPPYKPITKTSSFTSYTASSFNDNDQCRLGAFCETLSRSKSKFVLSNSDVQAVDTSNSFFEDLYRAFRIERVLASRMVNSNGAGRGKISELIISNTY